MAKLCRSVCGPTRLVISAACATSTTMRWSCLVLIGFMACCPGNRPTVAVHHALLVPELPPLAQQSEQIGREHGIADTGLPCHARPGSACARCRYRRP